MIAQSPHAGQPVLVAGRPEDRASAAAILVHGRGASAKDILLLAAELEQPELAYLAPQAAGSSWYPRSFLAPIELNEPGLSSGLSVLAGLVDRLGDSGIPAEHILLVGFSQGACLTLEFVARNAQRYGGVAGLTGGLIGPPGTARDYAGDLAETPIFLGSGDPDPHVPWERVAESADVFARMGAEVDLRRYPGMPHTISADEIEAVRTLAGRLVRGRSG
jgi:predicted esterase